MYNSSKTLSNTGSSQTANFSQFGSLCLPVRNLTTSKLENDSILKPAFWAQSHARGISCCCWGQFIHVPVLVRATWEGISVVIFLSIVRAWPQFYSLNSFLGFRKQWERGWPMSFADLFLFARTLFLFCFQLKENFLFFFGDWCVMA